MTSPMMKGSVGRTLDTMIELARCSAGDRIILAGAGESGRMCEWRRRGYRRVATTATCRLPHGQYDAACIEWRRHSINALEATLDWLVHFLSPTGALIIWIDTAIDTPEGQRHLRSAIDRFGFRVEVETQRAGGLAISARRIAFVERTVVAV